MFLRAIRKLLKLKQKLSAFESGRAAGFEEM
jgi:hypothetical protein